MSNQTASGDDQTSPILTSEVNPGRHGGLCPQKTSTDAPSARSAGGEKAELDGESEVAQPYPEGRARGRRGRQSRRPAGSHDEPDDAQGGCRSQAYEHDDPVSQSDTHENRGFQYRARLMLADGTTEYIGKTVNQEKQVEILVTDPATGRCMPRPITGWHKLENADSFLQLVTEKVGGNGRSQMGLTPDQFVYTPTGYQAASELEEGAQVYGMAFDLLSPFQRQAALGSVLGDGHLKKTGRYTVTLRIRHGEDQIAYARWKSSLFGDYVAYSGSGTYHDSEGEEKESWGFATRPSADLLQVMKEAYVADGRAMSSRLLSELGMTGVAIWYMDDATFGGSYSHWGKGKVEIPLKSYTYGERLQLAKRLHDLGIPLPTFRDTGHLQWSGEDCWTLQEKVARLIHPSMDYKLHPDLRGRFGEPEVGNPSPSFRLIPLKVKDVYTKPETRSMRQFSVSVADGYPILIDGVAMASDIRDV